MFYKFEKEIFMSFSVVNNIAKINGENGCYDTEIADKSVRYGRNAIHNFNVYLYMLLRREEISRFFPIGNFLLSLLLHLILTKNFSTR